ncbi:MAG: hypothetical protein CR985_01655 [Flavobacteriales bacterium]|nr:MAG: hypothetical protein CR985_01655 [Flavobacteriales bacterium]
MNTKLLNDIHENLNFQNKSCNEFFINVSKKYTSYLHDKFVNYIDGLSVENKKAINEKVEQLNKTEILNLLESPIMSYNLLHENDRLSKLKRLLRGIESELMYKRKEFDISLGKYYWIVDGSRLTYWNGDEFLQFEAPKIEGKIIFSKIQ